MYFYDDCYIKASFPTGVLQATITTVNNGDGTYTHTARIPNSYPNAMTLTTSNNLLFRKESAYISVMPQFYLISAGQTAKCQVQYTTDGNNISSDSTNQLTLNPNFYKQSASLTTSSPDVNYEISVKTDLSYFTFQRTNDFRYAPVTDSQTLTIKYGPVSSGTTISILDEPVIVYSPSREVERYQISSVMARDTYAALPLIANGTSVKRLTVKTGVKTTELIHKWTHLNRMCNKIVFGQVNNKSEDLNQLKCVGNKNGGIALSWNTLPDVLKINVGISVMETIPSSITGGTLEVRGIFVQNAEGPGIYKSCSAVGTYTFSSWDSSSQVANFNLSSSSSGSGSFDEEEKGLLILGFGGSLSIVFYGTTYSVTMPTLIDKYQWFSFPSFTPRTATLTENINNPSVYGQWNMSTGSWDKVY